MTTQEHSCISIAEAIKAIEKDRFVMPSFQRQFVWTTKQIEKLWDSILRGLPIASFILWKIDEKNVTPDTVFCHFLKKVTFNCKGAPDGVDFTPQKLDLTKTDTAVLDGQQRLTSLYLSLVGDVYRRPYRARQNGINKSPNIYINLSPKADINAAEELNGDVFDIFFTESRPKRGTNYFELKKVFTDEFSNSSTRENAIENSISNIIIEDEHEYAANILHTLCSKIFDEKLISYTRISNMSFNDALGLFVRFNSGGKPLDRSEITMSIIETSWSGAKHKFEIMCARKFNNFGFEFIIRAALMLYGDVAKSAISNNVISALRNNWQKFESTLDRLCNVFKNLHFNIKIFETRWNVLLPIIYVLYYNTEKSIDYDGIRSYIVRAVLFTYFQAGTTAKLSVLRTAIEKNNGQLDVSLLDDFKELKITNDRIETVLASQKGSNIAKLALYFLSCERVQNLRSYDQDHLHAEAYFRRMRPCCVDSDNEWEIWKKSYNQLPNLWLLDRYNNQIKNSRSLEEFWDSLSEQSRQQFIKDADIPNNSSLALEDFGAFFEARKVLLRTKLLTLMGAIDY